MLDHSIIDKIFKLKPLRVAVGVSGGADSLCLTSILNTWCKLHNVELIAYIVDHKLRSESTLEALSVQKLLSDLGINTKVLTATFAGKPRSNVQNFARTLRFELFRHECERDNITHLFLAHTLNDQAETVLMRIIRGCSIKGISGIKAISNYQGIKLIRPLLKTPRQAIESYLRQKGISWINDPSNHNLKYDRIKARQMLKNYHQFFDNHLIYQRLSQLGEHAGRTASYIDKRVNKVWAAKIVVDKKLNFITICNSLYQLNSEILLNTFKKILKHFHSNKPPVRMDSLEELVTNLKQHHKITKTLGGCVIEKTTRGKTLVYLEIGKLAHNVSAIEPTTVNQWHNLRVLANEQLELGVGFIGRNGWAELKSKGLKRPDNISINIIYSLMGVFHEGALIAVPQLDYYLRKIDVTIRSKI